MIRIGTLLKGLNDPAAAIRSLSERGFESWSIMFWETIGPTDLPRLAAEVRAAIDAAAATTSQKPAVVSSLSVYGNPLRADETGAEIRRSWEALIEAAPLFGAPVVSGFAGRVVGTGVEASIAPWAALFSGWLERAAALGVGLALENCRMGDTWKTGKWNIAINPDAWELMFDALDAPNLGLEWEPCHQVEALADPLPQLKTWAGKVLHVHGKDARLDRAALSRHGLYGSRKFSASCLPGHGDTDWSGVFRTLADSGFAGSVDIEGWNDATWSGEREIEGQTDSLRYLKSCRGRFPS